MSVVSGEIRRWMNARRGRTVWRAVQLCRSRGASAARSSVARHSGDCERSAGGAGARVRGVVFADGAAFDPAGKAAAGNAAANLLFDSLGASFDGAAGVRPSVPLVCRDRRRRRGVGPKNRDRLLDGDIAANFLSAVLAQPTVKKLLSTDHFSVDGTLIAAWASMKSVKAKDGSGERPAEGGGRNTERDFHGQKRSNDTHASTTDPEARLYRKGQGGEALLHGTWLDGEPPRPVGRCLPDAGRRSCPAGGGAAHD